MPLDPQIQPILDLLGGELRVDDKTPDEARAQSSTVLPRDEAGLSRVEDIKVQGGNGLIAARLYRPEGAVSPAPAIVYFHGGGWVICNIDTHDNACARLAAETGCVVVNVEYRLAPEHKFPAGLEDAYAATAWVVEHAGDLGVDPARVAVAGDSAGGNLAAALCLLAKERGGPAIAYQLLIYPVTDITMAYPSYAENGELNLILSSRGMRWFLEQYVGGVEGVDWRAAPIQAPDVAGLPPALVVTAEYDPLRDEGEAYARRLSEAGVAVETIRGEGMVHGFFNFPVDEATRCRDVVYATIRGVLVT